jgi:hypothetical protein
LDKEENMRVPIISGMLTIWIGAMLIGCGSPRWFQRPVPESLVLGKTTYQEATLLYGEPTVRGTMTLNGENVNTANWSFAGGPPQQFWEKHFIPTKSLVMFFWNDLLVGHAYTSSYQEDNTDFDESQIPRIKKGETTVEEVAKLLGQASGMFIYPCTENADTKAMKYLYTQAKSSSDSYTKEATIVYNNEGIVTNVVFSTSGEK